ncbi:MAG: T9SS type A sorting domain-containing protein [Bacteroidota bacterium]
MKKLYPFLIALSMICLFSGHSKAQYVALFVNDNGLFKANTDTVLSALAAAGIPIDVFNARDSLRSPTAVEMHPYALVIWYCSTDGVKNYLWEGNDSDNAELTLYLEGGGKLLLMGADFLYDRYGSAPDIFHPGDFVYDYLGISTYNAQSYGDDGGLGVPELDPVNLPSMTLELDTIHWIYSTAWWIDGCTPAGSAATVYNMGPGTYPLNGLSSAIYNHYEAYSGQKELSFFFDPALMDSFENRVHLFSWSYDSFFILPSGVEELPTSEVTLITGQNPAKDHLQYKIPEGLAGAKIFTGITDMTGRKFLSHFSENYGVFNLDISALSPGIYVLSVTDGTKRYCQKFVVNR